MLNTRGVTRSWPNSPRIDKRSKTIMEMTSCLHMSATWLAPKTMMATRGLTMNNQQHTPLPWLQQCQGSLQDQSTDQGAPPQHQWRVGRWKHSSSAMTHRRDAFLRARCLQRDQHEGYPQLRARKLGRDNASGRRHVRINALFSEYPKW